MIIRVHPRALGAHEPLLEALGAPFDERGTLIDRYVIAQWPGLNDHKLFRTREWRSIEYIEHLEGPGFQHPETTSSEADRRPIWHADVRLHPDDRALSGAEWSEIAHRVIRAAGLHSTTNRPEFRWLAVQAQSGRLHVVANLIRSDGTWAAMPPGQVSRLADESRCLESDLGLISHRTGPDPQQPARQARFLLPRVDDASAADTASHPAVLLQQLAEERTGPLATVRGLIQHAAHHLEELPDAHSRDSAHQLEMIARRLHGIQQSLESLATALPPAARTNLAGPTSAAPAPATTPRGPAARSAR
ncbi:hypothetical protein ACN2WE_30810 [Streptomyces sp. cg28]|uniref:hypothetical protein n=1 Tax=Streptomyces sp. cg28 TaxID=3403457 RepID=UPI003B22126C